MCSFVCSGFLKRLFMPWHLHWWHFKTSSPSWAETYRRLPWQFCNFTCEITNYRWNYAPKLRSNSSSMKSLPFIQWWGNLLCQSSWENHGNSWLTRPRNLRFQQRKKTLGVLVLMVTAVRSAFCDSLRPLLSALKVKLVRSTCGKSEEPHLQTR